MKSKTFTASRNLSVKTPVFMTLATLIVLLSSSFSQAQNVTDFETVLKQIDINSLFPADMTATVTLDERDPANGDEVSKIRMFRRDEDDKFLLLFERPEVQLGQGYLNIDDGLWFYDPESRQFTFTSISESFGGSDARNSDFQASSLAADYDVIASSEGTLGKFDVWILELEASNDEVTYPFRKLWVTKEPNLILKSEDYSLTKRLLRTSYFPSYAKAGDSFVADQQLYVDALVENKQTKVTIEDISTAEIPDNVFTKAYVERVNR
jgi:hypothetical protein